MSIRKKIKKVSKNWTITHKKWTMICKKAKDKTLTLNDVNAPCGFCNEFRACVEECPIYRPVCDDGINLFGNITKEMKDPYCFDCPERTRIKKLGKKIRKEIKWDVVYSIAAKILDVVNKNKF